MKAIRFYTDATRYVLGLALGRLAPSVLWSGLSCTRYEDVPDPVPPGDEWLVIKTRLGGICGSDTSTIFLHASPYHSAFTSSPFTLGHENTGIIAENGRSSGAWKAGERVVVEPILWCGPRGFDNLCQFCARGEINRCERITDGHLSSGGLNSICMDVGGCWGAYYIAHHSQIYRVPDAVSDENAMLIEPFAIGLHAALQNFPKDSDKVLIVGVGAIGLGTLAALRALGSQAEILVLARHAFQEQAALRLGASRVIRAAGREAYYAELAELTQARLKRPVIGKPVMVGGADMVFECAGSSASLDDSLRLARNGGRVVLVGMPGLAKGVDWTAIFVQELVVRSAYLYHHAETFRGKRWNTFDLAIDLMARGKVDLGWMVTHRFPLDEYGRAFEMTRRRGGSEAIKIAFEFPGE